MGCDGITLSAKALLFDYGGTLDSGGEHWFRVLWRYFREEQLGVAEEHYRQAYVHAERWLGGVGVVAADCSFHRLLEMKIDRHFEWLIGKGCLPQRSYRVERLDILDKCYSFALHNLARSKVLLTSLKERCPLMLVSNFYGNLRCVLGEMGLDGFFELVVESAVVGCRKPDLAIFRIVLDRSGYAPEDVVVVGDSLSNDIIPASTLGMRSVWLRGEGWGDRYDAPDEAVVIRDLAELEGMLK